MKVVSVENMTGRMLFARTLSGQIVELSPAVSPVELPERELAANAGIKKLLEQGAIRMVQRSIKKEKQPSSIKKETASEKAKIKTEKTEKAADKVQKE